MKIKKVLIYSLVLIFIASTVLFLLHNKLKTQTGDKIETKISESSSAEKYKYEKTEKNVINKKFDGNYMSPFITIVKENSDFDINLEGISEECEVALIDSMSGEMFSIQYNENKHSLKKINLKEDIDYGILIDDKLVGSIRVVENLNKTNEIDLYNEIMKNLNCGL